MALAWFSVVAAALLAYVVFDGFDLGVGILLLFVRDESERDRMIASVAPTWDGNETWIVLAGVGLLGGFSHAYAALLPAFYLPLILMLLALAFRGASFEFRFHTERNRKLWDLAFGGGSLLAATCQGFVLGGVLQGVRTQGLDFAGSPFDVFDLFTILCGATVAVTYGVLGAAWLVVKASGDLRVRAQRFARALVIGSGFLATSQTLMLLVIRSGGRVWLAFGGLAAFWLAVLWLHSALGSDDRRAPWFAPILPLIGFAAIAGTIYPYIVPYNITIDQASAPAPAQTLLLTGIAIVMPIVIVYSAFAFVTFRGTTPIDPEALPDDVERTAAGETLALGDPA